MITEFEDIYDITTTIFSETIDTAIYYNRMISGLYLGYMVDGEITSIEGLYDPYEIRRAWEQFTNIANREMNDMDELIDELEEEDEFNLSMAIDAIIDWDQLQEMQHHLKADNFHKIESWDELRKKMKEYRNFSEWNEAIETYWEEVQHQLIERLMRDW